MKIIKLGTALALVLTTTLGQQAIAQPRDPNAPPPPPHGQDARRPAPPQKGDPRHAPPPPQGQKHAGPKQPGPDHAGPNHAGNCPPGLAKKDPRCQPPGQAKKADRNPPPPPHEKGRKADRNPPPFGKRVGERLRTERYDTIRDPRRYDIRPRDGARYYRDNDRVYEVDTKTQQILAVMSLLSMN